jgi:hypothetical protein
MARSVPSLLVAGWEMEIDLHPTHQVWLGVVLQRHRKHLAHIKMRVGSSVICAKAMVKLGAEYSQESHGPPFTTLQTAFLFQDLELDIAPKSPSPTLSLTSVLHKTFSATDR